MVDDFSFGSRYSISFVMSDARTIGVIASGSFSTRTSSVGRSISFFNDAPTTGFYTLPLPDALPFLKGMTAPALVWQ